MQYGVDVASTRLDDLDKKILAQVHAYIAGGITPHVLDVGCGGGGLTAALLAAGARVTAIDLDDYSQVISGRVTTVRNPQGNYQFEQADIRTWVARTSTSYDMVVLQRMVHYLPYEDARSLLAALLPRATHLYCAITGLRTAIARHYDGARLPLRERFTRLDNEGQQVFSITAPVCLYSEDEVRQLFIESGWQIEWLRVSDFGNTKVVAVPTKQ